MVHHPRYYKARCMVLSDKSESIRNAIKRARDSGLDLPPSPRGDRALLEWANKDILG